MRFDFREREEWITGEILDRCLEPLEAGDIFVDDF